MWYVELIGIAATIFIVISMSIDTRSWKGDVVMRVINIVGSVVFVVYGSLLPAISTAVLNGILVVVNTYHLIKLIKTKNAIQNANNPEAEKPANVADKSADSAQ